MTIGIDTYRHRISNHKYTNKTTKPIRIFPYFSKVHKDYKKLHIILMTLITTDILMSLTMLNYTNTHRLTNTYDSYEYSTNRTTYITDGHFVYIYSNPLPLGHKYFNKLIKIINGNRANFKSLNIFHINKGNAKFENKLSDIDNIISKHNPDILHIAEANISSNFDTYLN